MIDADEAREQLALIREVVERSRQERSQSGDIYVVWGVIVCLCLAATLHPAAGAVASHGAADPGPPQGRPQATRPANGECDYRISLFQIVQIVESASAGPAPVQRLPTVTFE